MPRHTRFHCIHLDRHYQNIKSKALEWRRLVMAERHSDADARALIMDLIEDGVVGKLFIETTNENISFLNIGGCNTFQDFLDANVGSQLTISNDWQKLKPYIKAAQIQKDAEIELTRVIETALRNNVVVIAYDLDVRLYKRINAFSLAKRNETMGRVYKQNRGLNNGKSSILLVGALHVNPSENMGGVTLQKAASIGSSRVIDVTQLQ